MAEGCRKTRFQVNTDQAIELLERITIACAESPNFGDASTLKPLPFPSLLNAPDRFRVDQTISYPPWQYFQYMGRTGYQNLRNIVLGLYPMSRSLVLGTLPVRPAVEPSNLYVKAALWGTMGSGKSYMLAALACDLISSFQRNSRDATNGFQRQRAIYIPDCEQLLSGTVDAFHHFLSLAYADDEEALARIRSISDETDIVDFAVDESIRGVLLYWIVDQVNALEPSSNNSDGIELKKARILSLIDELTVCHVILKSASANNLNAQQWRSNRVRNVAVVFHHGGLDEAEYLNWKKHFGESTPLQLLEGDSEERVRDATGCVPLFLNCWGVCSSSLENAWENFVNLPEISLADDNLKLFIEGQLNDAAHLETRLEMYSQFMTEGKVTAQPVRYDCRYLYVKDGVGRCVCGLYRDLIAEIFQRFHKLRFIQNEWGQAISREVQKSSSNFTLLGFMVEQQLIAQIAINGVPLYGKRALKCNKVQYFKTGEESLMQVEEGCILYVPHAFNYHHVNVVIRQYVKSRPLYQGPPPQPEDLIMVYDQLPLQVAGVQITIGSLRNHLKSESQFCSLKVIKVWHPGFDIKDVALWFVWYALQSELDQYCRETLQLFTCAYGESEVKGKTRMQSVETLHHVAILYPVEDYEPRLRGLQL